MVHGVLSGVTPTQPGAPLSLNDPTELERLARDAGFARAIVEPIDVTFSVASVDDHLAHVTSLAPPLAQAFAAATDAQRAAVRETVTELTKQFRTDDGLAIPGRALLLEAR
jgi:hypothetical protein